MTDAQVPGAPDMFTFTSDVDQMAIYCRKWQPSCGVRARAAVQITHGILEHSGRYDRVARFFASQGAVVYALDLRGHGLTAGPDRLGRLGVTAWDDMASDIKQLADIACAENPGLPLIAFGHSMGSGLTQSHMENHGDLLAGAVLCGTLGAVPGLAADAYPAVIQQLEELATGPEAMAPSELFRFVLAEFNAPFVAGDSAPTGCEWQTSDIVEIRRFQSDPLCGKPFCNAMTYSVLKGFHSLWLPENEIRISADLPILIVTGSEDPVGERTTTVQGLISRYMAQGHLQLSYRFYEGGRHEILHEAEKDQVHRDMGHWLTHVLDAAG